MVANIGPADWNYDETLSTLRYANRCVHAQLWSVAEDSTDWSLALALQPPPCNLQHTVAAQLPQHAAH
jgi:hypothetical protein